MVCTAYTCNVQAEKKVYKTKSSRKEESVLQKTEIRVQKFKMLHPKVLVFISVLLPITMANVASPKKRTVSYTVEGCFSSFPGVGETHYFVDNSNVKCQDTCRDKGYILAATKKNQCQCGNIYPKGQKVDDKQCTTSCQDWNSCHDVQSCCGGPNAYVVSVVGDIDVAKQILRRLSHEWRTNTRYRENMKGKATKPIFHSHDDDWSSSFDRQGWSVCAHGRYMTGLYRGDRPGYEADIYLIETANCADAPGYLYPSEDDQECYDHNWWQSFDHEGWSTCNEGYYMRGLFRTDGSGLHHIEAAKCCRPKSQGHRWGSCYHINLWSSFDHRGWGKCSSDHYMVGLYRSSCDKLYCLEDIKCCKMGEYNGDSWVERPDLVIKVKDASTEKLKRCSMNAKDTTPSSESYACNSSKVDDTNMLAIKALKFNIEDKSPPNVAKPQPIKGYRPVTCSAHSNPYKCTKAITTEITTSSTLTIGTGSSLAVNVGASTSVEGKIFGIGASATFSTEITKTSSFNVENSKTSTHKTTDNTEVSIEVPKDTEITINLLRTVQDLEYKWKAIFEFLGKYSAVWTINKRKQEIFEDVTTVLSGSKRKVYAFGSWRYPETDILRVVVTDKYGNQKSSGCEHKTGEGNSCEL